MSPFVVLIRMRGGVGAREQGRSAIQTRGEARFWEAHVSCGVGDVWKPGNSILERVEEGKPIDPREVIGVPRDEGEVVLQGRCGNDGVSEPNGLTPSKSNG